MGKSKVSPAVTAAVIVVAVAIVCVAGYFLMRRIETQPEPTIKEAPKAEDILGRPK